MTAPIVIVAYDPSWPATFARLRRRFDDFLGDVAVAIEHVGSTAVPGLGAKPKIDVDVVVRSGDDIPLAISRLAAAGYVHRGDLAVPDRETFEAPRDEPLQHLCVCVEGSAALRDHIVFRDHLRAHPERARAYEDLKRSLARSHGSDRDGYTRAKGAFVAATLAEARRN